MSLAITVVSAGILGGVLLSRWRAARGDGSSVLSRLLSGRGSE